MEKIIELFPAIQRLSPVEQTDAVARMCIAHVLNGGEFVGLFGTAVNYLESL